VHSSALLGVLCVMMGGLVACAQGNKFQGSNNGQSGDSGSAGVSGSAGNGSSGSSGASGASASGGAAGSGNAGGAMSSGGSGGSTSSSTATMCDEDPCKLAAPQCGCGAGEMCTLDDMLAIGCGPAGSVALGQKCDLMNDCAPGGHCAGVAKAQGYCVEFCDVDADCGAALCLINLNDASGNPVPGVTFCTSDCTPGTNVGCAVGLSCLVGKEQAGQMRTFGSCRGSGSGAHGATCMSSDDCSPGANCFVLNDANMTRLCLEYCNIASPVCPGNTQCTDLKLNYKGIDWGACY
jgi:hypothetical protein